MAIARLERKLLAIAPQLFTADGTTNGVVKVADSCLFRFRQDVIIRATGLNPLKVEVKEIADSTTILVGAPIYSFKDRVDISAYTTALGATIEAQRQAIKAIDHLEIGLSAFERSPVAAYRSVLVDKCGNIIDEDNPLSVGIDNITISDIDVKLKHNGVDPQPNNGDTVAIGNNKTGVNSRLLEINKNLDIDTRAHGWTISAKFKEGILCASDKSAAYTFTEIDGVDKVTQILFTSTELTAEAQALGNITGGEFLRVKRTIAYLGVDPFTLSSIIDALEVV